MKKQKLLVGICAACVVGVLLGGCQIYDKEDIPKMLATQSDAAAGEDHNNAEGDDMTKLRDYSKISTKKYAWYIVRDKNHMSYRRSATNWQSSFKTNGKMQRVYLYDFDHNPLGFGWRVGISNDRESNYSISFQPAADAVPSAHISGFPRKRLHGSAEIHRFLEDSVTDL